MSGISVTIKAHTWSHWMQNACEAEDQAHEARRALIAEIEEARPRESLTTEMRWSMRAVSESASAIEAIGGDALDAVGAAEGNEKPAWRRVLANASHAAMLCAEDWQHDLDWLFRLRNRTVHSKPKDAAPVVHPLGIEFMGSVGLEAAALTCEAATRAVDVAEAFIAAVVENPRKDPSAVAWSKQVSGLAHDYLPSLRRGSRNASFSRWPRG